MPSDPSPERHAKPRRAPAKPRLSPSVFNSERAKAARRLRDRPMTDAHGAVTPRDKALWELRAVQRVMWTIARRTGANPRARVEAGRLWLDLRDRVETLESPKAPEGPLPTPQERAQAAHAAIMRDVEAARAAERAGGRPDEEAPDEAGESPRDTPPGAGQPAEP